MRSTAQSRQPGNDYLELGISTEGVMGKRADLRRKHNDTTMSVVRIKRVNVTVIVWPRRRAGGENPMNRKRGNRMVLCQTKAQERDRGTAIKRVVSCCVTYVWEINVGVRRVGTVTMLGSRGQMGWKSGGRGRG